MNSSISSFRNILLPVIIVCTIVFNTMSAFAGTIAKDDGHITSPSETPYGIVFTDQYESSLYLASGGQMQLIARSPGCGRYYSLSPDKKLLGFKYINPATGMQQPALCDLNTLKITYLYEPSENCGQPSFSNDGKVVFTVGDKLVVRKGASEKTISLGVISNRTPVSPDGRYIIYNENDRLVLFDLDDNTRVQLTDNKNGYGDAKWSFDGRYISCQSINARISVIDVKLHKVVFTSEGENAAWAGDSDLMAFHRRDIDFEKFELKNSDVFLFNADNKELRQMTSTKDEKEMDASFSGSSVIYQSHGKNSILRQAATSRSDVQEIFTAKPLSVPEFELPSRLSRRPTAAARDFVHIHQIFDTRSDWNQGSRCCGATSAMQVLASYKILPPDPIYTAGPNGSRVSPYGKYISDTYTYNGIKYGGYSGGEWANGIHGLFWHDGTSPYSNIVQFLKNHGVSSYMNDYVSWSDVMTEVKDNYPYVVCSTGLTAAHIVMIIGNYGSTHTVVVNDPYGDKNPSGYDHSKYDGKEVIYDWSDANTGHQKVTPIAWAATARYSRRLQFYSSYPADGQKSVSTTAVIKLRFSEAINGATTGGSIILSDKNGVQLNVIIDTTQAKQGLIVVRPKFPLLPSELYRLDISSSIMSVSGLTPLTSRQISFTTGSENAVTGRSISGFEDSGEWVLDTPGSGVDAANTSFALTSNPTFSGSSAGALNYTFKSTGSFCYVKNNLQPFVTASVDSSFGIWVFGDASNNRLEFRIKDVLKNQTKVYYDTLSWTGWKFRQFLLNAPGDTGAKTLSGVALRQMGLTGSLSGTVYFDNALSTLTALRVASYTPTSALNVDTTAAVTITFNKPVNTQKTQEAVSISPFVKCDYVWENNNSRLKLLHSAAFSPSTVYTVKVDSAAEDVNGMKLSAPFSFSFKTKKARFALASNYPKYGQKEISTTVQILLKFNNPVDKASLAGNIQLVDADGKGVSVKANLDRLSEGKIWFSPSKPLFPGSLYRIKLRSGIKDSDLMALPADTAIEFTTTALDYQGGVILDSLENIAFWNQPDESGAVAENTYFELSKLQRVSGLASGRLVYRLKDTSGYCRIGWTGALDKIGGSKLGVWVYGDLSMNRLRFFISRGGFALLPFDLGPVDWTGWKLKMIDLSDVANVTSLLLGIEHSEGAALSGELYFDDLQQDIVLPVANETEKVIPQDFALLNNYPNPFNPSTVIAYDLPMESTVELKVYDILGNEVSVLEKGLRSAGRHSAIFNASAVSSGVYFCRIQAVSTSGARSFSSVRRMMLVK